MSHTNNAPNPLQIANTAIMGAEPKFTELVQAGSVDLNFKAEAIFALQQCQKGKYLASVAASNPMSLRFSMANVAAVGLSLNPALGYAYLVPRDGQVVLDISYKGLVKIATDIGSILWAKAEIVYEHDTYEYRGVSNEPLHRFNPFIPEERGDFIGVYCLAKTPDGDYLVENMSADQIYQVRQLSKAYNPGGNKPATGPWVTFPEEMSKKTVTKRSSKTWPKSRRDQRLHEAIHILNEHEGLRSEHLSGEQGIVVDSYSPELISPATKENVAKVIQRAKETGSFAAARDYIQERYRGPDLMYARELLAEAELATKAA